ncbi:MAG: acetyl-CoA C-acetyltransferase [Pseudomonadota bacterium]
MAQALRPVAIVGGVRTPFCRSNTAYSELSNKDMLATALQGLSTRFGLKDEQIDEVFAGAVVSHSRDWNLAREAVLSTDLSPLTPGVTLQQACGTSLQAAMISAAKIASGQIDCAIAAGADTTSDAPIVVGDKLRGRLIKLGRARTLKDRLKLFKGFSLRELAPVPPGTGEPRTGLSMGQHCELMAKTWGITREEQDALALDSHLNAAAAYDAGFMDAMLTPCAGVLRDNNMRPDSTLEALAGLRTAYDKSDKGTLTAGNSTPLTDGASTLLLASEEWARERDLPVLAYLTHSRHSAVDFVAGEGLLMAPAVAVSEMLTRAGLGLQDFDLYEIHEAFAAQVLCTLKAWESEDYCRDRLQRDAALGSIDRSRLNVNGSSLAVGHPFAATGARVLSMGAEALAARGNGKCLVSVCTAGGMGCVAVLER